MEDKRKPFIREIGAKRTSDGLRAGIYGGEVCQLCGEVGSFRGLAAAMGTHWLGEFVANGHGHGSNDEQQKALERSPDRYCEICQAALEPRPERRLKSTWVCGVCRPRLPGDARHAAEALLELSRRRWLDLNLRTVQAARAFEAETEWARLVLEDSNEQDAWERADEEERRTRRERWRRLT